MKQLYHDDMYDFNNPVKSYWESSVNYNSHDYKKIEKNEECNIVVIGAGYTGISCALTLAKNYNEDVVLVEAGHIGWGSSARNAGFCCIPPSKISVKKMFKKYGRSEIILGCIPSGSGNGLVKSLLYANGHPYSASSAAHLITRGETRKLDLITVSVDDNKKRTCFLAIS